uniref:Uncharacterized protein n=1 Tax=Sus scrofa TaxID=9823 RepID=A0A4X1W0X1_PIG
MSKYVSVTTAGKTVNGRKTNTKRSTENDQEREDGELKSFLLNGVADEEENKAYFTFFFFFFFFCFLGPHSQHMEVARLGV